MGFLSAFARGALGPGLLQVAQMQQRQQEVEAATKEREATRKDERDFRLQLARENQAGREDLAMLRAELAGGGRTRSRSAGGGGGEDVGAEDAAVYQIMRETGASGEQARGMLRAALDGKNPYSKAGTRPEQIDDGDRMRTVSVQTDEPDAERYIQLNRLVAKALMEAPANMKANPEQRAKGRQTDTETDAALAYGRGDVGAGRTGMMLKGKGEFGNNGSSELTGAAAPNSVAASQIRENDAQGAKARDGIGANADPLKLPPAVKAEVANLDAREREINSAIVKAQAEGAWSPEANPGQKQLQTSLAAVRMKRAQIIRQYMPEQKVGANADPLGLLNDAPAAAPAAAKLPEKKPEKEGGGMLKAMADKAGASVESSRKEGGAYQRIYARWREAGSGGPPLTAEEKAEARRFGLAVKG